jgi:uncharacterized YigZ family protein
MPATYKTIQSISQGLFKEKGSRFISFAIPLKSADEVKSHLDEYKRKYHDARHHCYAYVLGPDRKVWRVNDDGEPSGTAGKPIMGQINSFGLTNILIIVIRYFGGTLLGTSGLINAYRSSAMDAIERSKIIEQTVNVYYKIEFPYSILNKVMKHIKEEDLIQKSQDFGLECSLIIGIREDIKDKILNKFYSIEGVGMTYLYTD